MLAVVLALACGAAWASTLAPIRGVTSFVAPNCSVGTPVFNFTSSLFMYFDFDAMDAGNPLMMTSKGGNGGMNMTGAVVTDPSWFPANRPANAGNFVFSPGKVGNGLDFYNYFLPGPSNIRGLWELSVPLRNASAKNWLYYPTTADYLAFGSTQTPPYVPDITVSFWIKITSDNMVRFFGTGWLSFGIFGAKRNVYTSDSNGNLEETYGIRVGLSHHNPSGNVSLVFEYSSYSSLDGSYNRIALPYTKGVWSHYIVSMQRSGPEFVQFMVNGGVLKNVGLFNNLSPPQSGVTWLDDLPFDGAYTAPGPLSTEVDPFSTDTPVYFNANPFGAVDKSPGFAYGPYRNESLVFSTLNISYTLDEFAIFSTALNEDDMRLVYLVGSAGARLDSIDPFDGCLCPNTFSYSSAARRCVPCAPQCVTCSPREGSAVCQSCTDPAGVPPLCAATTCAPQCLTCGVSPSECLSCAEGFVGSAPPLCCAIRCTACEAANVSSCTACAATQVNILPNCPDVAQNTPSPKKAVSSSSLVVVAGGAIAGVFVLVILALVIVLVLARRKKVQKLKNFAKLMGPPVREDAWSRVYADWLVPRYALPNPRAYSVMDDYATPNPLAPALLAGLCESAPKRGLSDLVVAILAYTESVPGLTLTLLRQLIDLEVGATQSPETLFRQNSAATKFFQVFAKLRACEYVRKTIGPLVHDTLDKFHKASAAKPSAGKADDEAGGVYMVKLNEGIEVDPTRLSEGESADANKYKLMAVCSGFLEAVYASAADCPAALKEVLQYVASSVSRVFQNRSAQAMGGFFFLRLFCPAITSPHEYLIMQSEAKEDERRYLILVAKVLQNAANFVTFGKKEAHMADMNVFVESHIPRIQRFFVEQLFLGCNVMTNTYTGPSPAPPPIPPQIRANALCTIHENIRESGPGLATWLASHNAVPVQQQLEMIMSLPAPPAAVAPATQQ